MKIILLCSSQSNQKALANKLHSRFILDKIIITSSANKKSESLSIKKIKNILNKILSSLFTLFKFRRMWFGMLSYYSKRYPNFPINPELIVDDINDKRVEQIIDDSKPELVIVSGTNLLKNKLISKIHNYGKVMNLHTGISPYLKGGPDCTNWCLFLKEFSLIGNTIMWIDKGIDSGNIITTEQTNLTGKESLVDLKIKTMNHGHDLYIRAIDRFYNNKPLQNIPQSSLSPNRLFLSKHWGLKEQIIALFNYYAFYRSGEIHKLNHKLINLKDK